MSETTLEIDLSAIRNNYNVLRSKIPNKTLFLAVVKAFAYGSDATIVAKFLEKLGVDYFAVAYVSEGAALRNAGVKIPILVLHPQPINFKKAIDFKLEPSLYSEKVLAEFSTVAKEMNQTGFPVHIKFNTGLNRLGLSISETATVAAVLAKDSALSVKSIFSHLAASEDLKERDFTIKQVDVFSKICYIFEGIYGKVSIRHICNTSGVVNYPEAAFEMVRCGIGLYGFSNSAKGNFGLKPVLTLKTVISQIHTLEQGDSVGYNRGYISKGAKKIATLPIGHADGIGRQYGNGVGCVNIHGQKAPIIGNVCMDMIMVDVTKINCKEGDSVVVFDARTTAEQLAESVQTISYELLTSLSQRIKRNVIYP